MLLTALLALGACEEAGWRGPPGLEVFEGQPDVLVIVFDALRRDHLGAYGYPLPTTPFLDGLAERGVVFDNAYAQASQTLNSTATLLTSRYFPLMTKNLRYEPVPGASPRAQRDHAKQPYLMDQNLTLAEAMADGGYTTVGIFTNPHHHPTSGFFQGFEEARLLPFEKGFTNYAEAPRVLEAFLEWYDRRRTPDAPYFAYLHFMDPHEPQKPPQRLQQQFVKVQGRPGLFFSGKPEGDRIPTEQDLAYMIGLYDASLRFGDEVIGDLVAALEERDRWRNLVVIVTSDHGDEFMDHGGLGHGQTLEKEMIHIPLFIHLVPSAEGRQPGAARVAPLVRNLDLPPTVVELAGLPVPEVFEGISLAPFLAGQEVPADRPRSSLAWHRQLRSLTTDQWHFIWNLETDERRLYDNRADPKGLSNIADDEAETVDRFMARLRDYEEQLRDTRQLAERLAEENIELLPDADLDPEIVEQLKALGYLN